jgi:hypothetical protein
MKDSPIVMPKDPLLIYTAARKIADIAFELYSPDPKLDGWLDDRRDQGVNPYYNQTIDGLFIEQYYGIPGSIWTPWGKWGCWGSGTSRLDLMEDFLHRVGEAVEAIPVVNTRDGTLGPVFAVVRVGDIVLPKPELRDRGSLIKYEEAKRLWAEVDQQFRETQVEA